LQRFLQSLRNFLPRGWASGHHILHVVRYVGGLTPS
jgi:hypothetical protein